MGPGLQPTGRGSGACEGPGLVGLAGGRAAAGLLCAAAAVASVPAGCGRVTVGPMRPLVFEPEALARSVSARAKPIASLVARDAVIRVSIKKAEADIYVQDDDKFRLDVRHPAAGKIATLVLNGGEFVFVNRLKHEAYKDELAKLLSERLPGMGLGPEDISPRELFLPTFDPGPGEIMDLSYGRTTYIVDVWDSERARRALRVEDDDWSQAPTRARVYRDDGRTAAVLTWGRFEYLEEHDIVLAKSVEIRLPLKRRTVKFILRGVRLSKSPIIDDRAFRLRVPPGVELKPCLPAGRDIPPAEGAAEKTAK